MDPNANANVQAPQPNPAAAPQSDTANGTNPAPAAADTAKGATQPTDPVATGTSGFDPEVQKFLDNQNIKTDDLKAAVTELARRNMKFRGHSTTQAPANPTQEVADVLNPKPTQPTQAQSTEPAQPSQPAQPAEQKPTSQPHTLSDMDIANVSMFVKSQYPDVKADAEFYKAMIADGFQPTKDGQINLKSVMSYAAYKQKLADADKAIAANQPQAGQLPQPSNAPEYAQVDKVQTMNETAAQNIIMFSNNEKRFGRPIHPQYEEAVKFIQDLARKGK